MDKDEWLNNPRPQCDWCKELKDDVKDYIDPFFVEGIYTLGKNTLHVCLDCLYERKMDV